MIDVNTIIGETIYINENTTIIPISKVTFGFAAGGSEFNGETIDEYTKKDKEEEIQYRLPFGGGSGAGVKVCPVAFLCVQDNNIKLLPVDHTSAIDKLLDYVPDLFEKTNEIINKLTSKDASVDDPKTNKNKISSDVGGTNAYIHLKKRNNKKSDNIGFDDVITSENEEIDKNEDY